MPLLLLVQPLKLLLLTAKVLAGLRRGRFQPQLFAAQAARGDARVVQARALLLHGQTQALRLALQRGGMLTRLLQRAALLLRRLTAGAHCQRQRRCFRLRLFKLLLRVAQLAAGGAKAVDFRRLRLQRRQALLRIGNRTGDVLRFVLEAL